MQQLLKRGIAGLQLWVGAKAGDPSVVGDQDQRDIAIQAVDRFHHLGFRAVVKGTCRSLPVVQPMHQPLGAGPQHSNGLVRPFLG